MVGFIRMIRAHWRVILVLLALTPVDTLVIGPMGVVVKPIDNIHVPLGSWSHNLLLDYPCLPDALVAVGQGTPDNFLNQTLKRIVMPQNATVSRAAIAEITATRTALDVQVQDIQSRLASLIEADERGLGLFNNTMCRRVTQGSSRSRRALFAPWGSVLKSLWGLATEADLQQIRGVLTAINAKQTITEAQVKQMQTHMNAVTTALRSQLTKETQALNSQIKELREAVAKQLDHIEAQFTTTVDEIYITIGYASVVQHTQAILTNIRLLIARKEVIIASIVGMAQSGVLNPSILPSPATLDILTRTQRSLPPGYQLLPAYYTGALYTNRVLKIWGGATNLILHLDLLIEKQFTDMKTWQVFSLPIYVGAAWAQYDVHNQVLIRTSKPDAMAILSLQEYQSCLASPFQACTRGILWRDESSSQCARYLIDPHPTSNIPCPLSSVILESETQVSRGLYVLYLGNNSWYISNSGDPVIGSLACVKPARKTEAINVHHVQLVTVSQDCTAFIPGVGKMVPFKNQYGSTTSNINVYYPDVLFSGKVSLDPWPVNAPPPIFDRELWDSQLGDTHFQETIASDTSAIQTLLKQQSDRDAALWAKQKVASAVLEARLEELDHMWSFGGQTLGNWLVSVIMILIVLWACWKCRARLCCKAAPAAVIMSGSLPLVKSAPTNTTWIDTQVIAHTEMPLTPILLPICCSIFMAWVMYKFFSRSRLYHDRILMSSGWIGRNTNTLHHPGEVRLIAHFIIRFKSRFTKHEAVTDCPVQICTLPGQPQDWYCVTTMFNPALNPPVRFTSRTSAVNIPLSWGPLCIKNRKWTKLDTCTELPKVIKVTASDLTLPVSSQLPSLYWVADVMGLSRLSILPNRGGYPIYSDQYADKKK